MMNLHITGSKIPGTVNPSDKLPIVASLIEKDFNEAWFDNKAWVRSSLVQESHSCVWRALMTEKLASIVDALELLVDDNVGCSRRNALFRNVYAIPRQSEQFANAQRAGKRQIQAQFQSLIFTAVNRVEQRLRIPNVALLHFVFREGCKLGRVLFEELPFFGLIESAVQKIVDFANRRRLHKLSAMAILLVRHQGHRGRFQQSLIEHFQHPRRNFLQPQFAEFGGNVVPNQPGV